VSQQPDDAAPPGASDAAPPDAARKRRSGFRALRHRSFQLYFAGMLIRGSAIWTLFVALPWYLVSAGAGPGDVGLVTALQFLPVFIIAPLGGVLGDRVNRAAVLFTTQALSAVLGAVLALLVINGVTNLAPFAACAFVLGVLIAAELPVRQAYLTELVPPADSTSAVSLHATAWNTTRFLGPAIAGLVIAGPGIATAFLLVTVATSLVALSIVVMERIRPPYQTRRGGGESVLRSLTDGFRFALAEPRIRWALVFASSTTIFGIMSFQTLAPIFAKEELGLDGAGFGGLLAVWGLGSVVATYIVTAVAYGDRRPWLIGGSLAYAALLALFSFASVVPVAYALAFLIGIAQIAVVQNSLVSVQRAVPDAMRARVMGVYVMLYQGSNPFGAAFAGGVAEVFDVRVAMLAAAAMLGFIALAAAAALRRTRL
jgi:MFS family permease